MSDEPVEGLKETKSRRSCLKTVAILSSAIILTIIIILSPLIFLFSMVAECYVNENRSDFLPIAIISIVIGTGILLLGFKSYLRSIKIVTILSGILVIFFGLIFVLKT